MKNPNTPKVLLTFAVIFAILFHRKTLGINVVIFESLLITWFAFTRQLKLKTLFERLIGVSLIVSLFFTILHNSVWSYVIHFAVFFVFIGVLIAPKLRSLINVIGMSFSNIFLSYHVLFNTEVEEVTIEKSSKRSIRFKRLKYYIIPVAVIILFATLYGIANPNFGAYVDAILGEVFEAIRYFFQTFDFQWIFTFFLGVIICIFIFMRRKNKVLEERDRASEDDKKRVRNRPASSMMRLKNEYRSGIFLFGALNVLLLLMNIMDIDKVWLNFEFEGQYLKEFVHYGTIVLIIAVMLSIGLVLTFFRGNLNFYSKNIWLKRLCYLWLGQNVILAISAGVRNFYYIQHYSLAYKRIAIIFFLVLVIYGLYSVYVKVRDTRSNFYLLRKNAVVWMIVFVVSAGFNWDSIIAKYNFSRGEGSFIHLDFLAELSDPALPYLDQPLDKLHTLDQQQIRRFKLFSSGSFSSGHYRDLYMSPEQYSMEIEFRKAAFQISYRKRSWLEWNYADWKTYQELSKTTKG